MESFTAFNTHPVVGDCFIATINGTKQRIDTIDYKRSCRNYAKGIERIPDPAEPPNVCTEQDFNVTIRTLIVEDTPETLDYLHNHLKNLSDIHVVAAVGTYQDGLAHIDDGIDLLVTDIGLPDGNGIDLIREIKKKASTKAIVVSVFGDERNVVSAIEAGADGYLLKDADGQTISNALDDALNGVAPISPAIAGHLLKRIKMNVTYDGAAQTSPSPIKLTETETIILETLAKGFSYKEIARIQGVTFFTVNQHLKTIYKKLAVHSRGEAVYEAVRSGLINP